MKNLEQADFDAVSGGLQSTSISRRDDSVRDQIEAMKRQQERQMIIDMFSSQQNVAA